MRVEIVVFFSCVYRTCVTLFLTLLALQVKDLVVSMSSGALIQVPESGQFCEKWLCIRRKGWE